MFKGILGVIVGWLIFGSLILWPNIVACIGGIVIVSILFYFFGVMFWELFTDG